MTEYVIERLGHLGDGIARGPIFAPLTLPGEVVEGVLDGDTLHDIRILTPSSDRVRPMCSHFKACGGCQVQHVSDAFQADWKTGIVRAALAANDLEVEFLPMTVSAPRSRRRVTFSVKRTKSGALCGFHTRKSDTIVDVPNCTILHPDLLDARRIAASLAVLGASRKQVMRLSITLCRNGLDVQVSDCKPLTGDMRWQLANLAGDYNLARLTWEDEVVVTRLPPEQLFDGIPVIPPPGAFLQATAEGEDALRNEVADIVSGARRIVDFFAGCGTFALPLSRKSEVHAVEGEADMVAALDQAWRGTTGFKQVTSETRDLFRRPLLLDELQSFDAAVIDPPRVGAVAQIGELAGSGIKTIAYVSCNPVSFARDARILVENGYELRSVRIVDQFRWSAHVELVARFEKTGKA